MILKYLSHNRQCILNIETDTCEAFHACGVNPSVCTRRSIFIVHLTQTSWQVLMWGQDHMSHAHKLDTHTHTHTHTQTPEMVRSPQQHCKYLPLFIHNTGHLSQKRQGFPPNEAMHKAWYAKMNRRTWGFLLNIYWPTMSVGAYGCNAIQPSQNRKRVSYQCTKYRPSVSNW